MPPTPPASVLDSLGDVTSLLVAAVAFALLFAVVALLDRV